MKRPDITATDAFLARGTCDNLLSNMPELEPEMIQLAAEVLVDELDHQGTSSPTVERAMGLIRLGKTARLRAQVTRIEKGRRK